MPHQPHTDWVDADGVLSHRATFYCAAQSLRSYDCGSSQRKNARETRAVPGKSHPPSPEYTQKHAEAEEADHDAGHMRNNTHHARIDPGVKKTDDARDRYPPES